MNKNPLSLVAVLAAAVALAGCGNTAQGVAEDASNNANAVANAPKAVANAAENAAQATANVASNATNAVANAGANAANAVSNAGEAVAQGASNAVNATSNAAANAGQVAANAASGAVNAASNAGAAVKGGYTAAIVTGAVKTALSANADLSTGGKSVIDVDTKDGKIILRGAVKTAELKKTAQTIAEKVKKDRGFSETIVNQLTVGGGN